MRPLVDTGDVAPDHIQEASCRTPEGIPEPPPEPVVTTGAPEYTLSFHHYQ